MYREPFNKLSPTYNSRVRPLTPQSIPVVYQHPKPPTRPHYGIPYQPYPPNLTKSRASINSSSSGLGILGQSDPNEIFPQDLVFLLRNEDRNINHFKQKIEKEKQKVQNDFGVLKNQIEHMIQDLKISFLAQLDLAYKTFITKYAELKTEVQQIRRMRKEILLQNGQGLPNFSNLNNSTLTSNKDLIQEIEKDAEQYRGYKIYGYLSQLIKQKLQPVLQLSNDLIVLGSTQRPFYRSKQTDAAMKDIKHSIQSFFGKIYDNLNDFISSPHRILEKGFEEELGSKLQRNFDHNIFPNEIIEPPEKEQVQISPNQQSLATNYCQNITLKRINTIPTDHTDAILCIFFIADKYIATGSKDKTINIYTLDGRKVTVLRGHQAAICCLSAIINSKRQIMLASGSDHGCSCLILWDTSSWIMNSRIQSHTAAVTAIVDMQDGHHLVTGSYDKKINLFNYNKGDLVFSLNNNKTSVSAIVLNSAKNRLVTSGLDNGLSIWTVIRRNNVVESIQLERTIPNNTLICCLNALQMIPEYVLGGTRDGKLKLFNIVTGEVVKTYAVNQNSIIELIIIERQMKDDSPIALSCSSKDKSLIMTKMDTGSGSYVNLDAGLAIQFGCGIGPKVVINRGGVMAVLSQSALRKQFSLYKIGMK